MGSEQKIYLACKPRGGSLGVAVDRKAGTPGCDREGVGIRRVPATGRVHAYLTSPEQAEFQAPSPSSLECLQWEDAT